MLAALAFALLITGQFLAVLYVTSWRDADWSPEVSSELPNFQVVEAKA